MVLNKVSNRYAKSLLSLALEQGVLEEALTDMQLLKKACEENDDLVRFLKSPVINAQKKEKILRMIFDGKLSKLGSSFIDILVRKGREKYVPGIARAFVAQYDDHKGISKAQITTAATMNEETQAAMRELISSMTDDKEIILNETVNPELIGGFIARLDDKQIDASIARKLDDLKKELNENPYIAEF